MSKPINTGKTSKIKIGKPCEPSEINWQNLSLPKQRKNLKICGWYLLVVIAVLFGLMLWGVFISFYTFSSELKTNTEFYYKCPDHEIFDPQKELTNHDEFMKTFESFPQYVHLHFVTYTFYLNNVRKSYCFCQSLDQIPSDSTHLLYTHCQNSRDLETFRQIGFYLQFPLFFTILFLQIILVKKIFSKMPFAFESTRKINQTIVLLVIFSFHFCVKTRSLYNPQFLYFILNNEPFQSLLDIWKKSFFQDPSKILDRPNTTAHHFGHFISLNLLIQAIALVILSVGFLLCECLRSKKSSLQESSKFYYLVSFAYALSVTGTVLILGPMLPVTYICLALILTILFCWKKYFLIKSTTKEDTHSWRLSGFLRSSMPFFLVFGIGHSALVLGDFQLFPSSREFFQKDISQVRV